MVDRSHGDVIRLVESSPLGWVVSHADGRFGATPLPLLPELDEAGALVALLGHFALSNRQVAQLRAAPAAAVIFQGPHGYIAPAMVSRPGWAPTWNYAAAIIHVDIEFVPDETRAAIDQLVAKMEGTAPGAWTTNMVGARYEGMMRRIIAFRAHVRAIEPRFKLGRDETIETLGEIVAGLEDGPLIEWTVAANADRLAAAAAERVG